MTTTSHHQNVAQRTGGPRRARRRAGLRRKREAALALLTLASTATITYPASAGAEPDTAPTMAARGVEAPLGTVPWAQVGPGWILAMWSPAPGLHPGESPPPGSPDWRTATKPLYLVDPVGRRSATTR